MVLQLQTGVQIGGLLAGGGLDALIKSNASRAVNTITRQAEKHARDAVLAQVNLRPSDVKDKLVINEFANPDKLTASLYGKGRPRTLARYAVASQPGVGVIVRVKSTPKLIRGAFFFGGSGTADGKKNRLLAIRLPKGATLYNRKKRVKLWRGLAFLYAPSVQQLLLDNQEQGEFRHLQQVLPARLAKEFARLMSVKGLKA